MSYAEILFYSRPWANPRIILTIAPKDSHLSLVSSLKTHHKKGATMTSVNLRTKLTIFFIIIILSAGSLGCSSNRKGPGKSGPGKSKPPSKAELFNTYDADNDNRLSKEEFPGPDEHFIQFDKNSDGYLDKDEVPDTPPSRGKRG